MMPPDITPILLAGGASTRFGADDKLVAHVDGTPLVQHVVDAVRAVTATRPIISVRQAEQRDRLRAALDPPTAVRFVRDDEAFSGPVAGVYGAIPEVETPWIFLGACDMPMMAPAAIEWLCERATPDRDVVIPVNEAGWLEPLHACYRQQALTAIRETLPAAPRVRAIPDQLTDVDMVSMAAAPAPLASSCRNINTKAELESISQASPAGRPAGGGVSRND